MQATVGPLRCLRTSGDGLLPTDGRATGKREKTFCEEATITPRTGRAAQRALWRVGGTPAPREKQTGAARASGVSNARRLLPLSRAAAAEYRTAPARAAVPAAPLGCAAHGRARKPRRAPGVEKSSRRTWNTRGDPPAGRFCSL